MPLPVPVGPAVFIVTVLAVPLRYKSLNLSEAPPKSIAASLCPALVPLGIILSPSGLNNNVVSPFPMYG